ncbi:DUF5906 domain-containing protein [Variovorax humicola]|uniref:DUF5906 domain-containing protein n=1 Tax=Variovorax humicola TaxID=1769758 RepID=A0ABU8VUG3_9BURK
MSGAIDQAHAPALAGYSLTSQPVPVSVFKRQTPLGKRIARGPDGAIVKEVHAQFFDGTVRTEHVHGLAGLAALRDTLTNCEALAFGVTEHAHAAVVTKKALAKGGHAATTVARAGAHVAYPAGVGVFVLDHDPLAGAPLFSPDALHAAVCTAVPGLSMATMIWAPSTSSCIYDAKSGVEVFGVKGQRLYLLISDASRSRELGDLIFDRLLLAGHGYTRYAGDGKPMVRTLIDECMYQPERLDFVRADCGPGLVQRMAPSRMFESGNGLTSDLFGDSVLNIDALAPLTATERRQVAQVRDRLTRAPEVLAESARIRAVWALEKAKQNAAAGASDGELAAIANEHATRAQGSQIAGSFPVTLENGTVVTVDEILAAPDIYDGMQCADPADGGKDLRVGKMMLKRTNGGGPTIYSHMHNGRYFDLVDLSGFSDCDSPVHRDDDRREAQKAENVKLQEAVIDVMPAIMTVAEMEANCVWIAEGSGVGRIDEPRQVLSFSDFAALTAASVTEIEGRPTKNGDGAKVREIPNALIWKKSPVRQTVTTRTFHPGARRICRDPDGRTALNTWRPSERWPASGNIRLFLDQLDYLFPDATERGKFLDWLAHLEQRPGELPHYGWLHFASNMGTGRNWLASLLARVWRGSVAPNVDLQNMLDSQFNGPLSGRTLAIVDEIQAGAGENPHRHANKLRALMTADVRNVNPKGKTEYQEHNACRWLVFSNHKNALPIDNGDRRWWVVQHTSAPRAAIVYSQLYAALADAEFVNSVGCFLRDRDIRGFNPGERPPMSEAKKAAVSASKSLAQKYADEFVAGWPVDIVTNRDVAKALSDGTCDTPTPAMRRALEELGCESLSRPLKINGTAARCWTIRNVGRWQAASPAEQVAEACRVPPADQAADAGGDPLF